MSYEDIINLEVGNHSLNENNNVFLYYYPGVNVSNKIINLVNLRIKQLN